MKYPWLSLVVASLLFGAGCTRKLPTPPLEQPGPSDADPPSKSQSDAEQKRLQGSWVVVSLEEKGKAVPDGPGRELVFFGDCFNLRDVRGKAIAVGTYHLDVEKPVKKMDLLAKEGPQAGQVSPSIYSLEGDELRICTAPWGAARPQEFASRADSDSSLLVLRRASIARKKVDKEELARLQGKWVAVAVEEKGQLLPNERGRQVVFLSDRFNLIAANGELLASGECRLDLKDGPGRIDLLSGEGPQAGQTVRALYAWEGDTLKLCLAPPGADRPSELSSRTGTANTLLVLQRGQANQASLNALREERDRLQGTWVATSVQERGSPIPEGKGRRFLAFGDQFNLVDPAGKVLAFGTYQLDVSAKPKSMDLIHKEGPQAGKATPLIYSLEGNTLTLCMAMGEAPRPTEFVSRANAAVSLLVLRRLKAIEADTELARLGGTWIAVSVEEKGKPVEASKGQQLIFLGEQFNLKDAAGKVLAFGKCTVDPSGPLKKLDLQHQGGQQAGQTVLAAYSLVDDVLTICTSSPGDGRPNELTSKAKPERALLIFKREKR